jgi:hypothetical protein
MSSGAARKYDVTCNLHGALWPLQADSIQCELSDVLRGMRCWLQVGSNTMPLRFDDPWSL